jgi:PAS domain S-box-containing protein
MAAQPSVSAQSSVSALLELLARQSPEHGFLFLDVKGIVTWISPGAQLILGYAPDEIIGKPMEILFTEEDRALGIPQYERDAALKEDPSEDDRWTLRKDGSRFWASGVLYSIRDAEGQCIGYGKIIRNRTDHREIVETLRNRVVALEEGARRQDAFISTLSHELANPLGPLLNAARIIRGAGAPTDDVEFALRVIERQVHLLRTLVSDLLEFSRAGAGKIELHPTRIVLNQVVADAVNDTRALMDERRHALQVIETRGRIELDADAERLHQVFVNLLTNAAKYTHPGGRINVKVATEDEEAVVRVEDNGVGIPHDMLPRIFDLFTQVDDTRPMAMGGLGIGLSLVKKLVDLHGGTVQVASEGRGKGSEFTVRIPLPPGEGSSGP